MDDTNTTDVQAEIITIGDEILIGQIVDTNSAYIASKLNDLGLTVKKITSISDSKEAIFKVLDTGIGDAGLIILTGGLGPTSDDITKTSLRDYFGGDFTEDRIAMTFIKKLCEKRGIPLSERNRFQAMVPDSCVTLRNRAGSAPGMLFRKEGCIVVSLPGVSFEMKDILDNELIPLLRKELDLPVRLQRTILTCGLPESTAADKLADFEASLPENTQLAYLPSPGILRLRISLSGDNRDYLTKELKRLSNHITKLLSDRYVFGYDDDSLPGVIARLLVGANLKLAVAESCTGGNITRIITSVPGSSEYLLGSVIAYANDIKINVLGVGKDLIDHSGAVSKEVVEAMASGVRDLTQADFGIATSGIAGPGGGSPEKPVGTIWIAVATPKQVVSWKFLFGDNRQRNIERASVTALNMARIHIIEYLENST